LKLTLITPVGPQLIWYRHQDDKTCRDTTNFVTWLYLTGQALSHISSHHLPLVLHIPHHGFRPRTAYATGTYSYPSSHVPSTDDSKAQKAVGAASSGGFGWFSSSSKEEKLEKAAMLYQDAAMAYTKMNKRELFHGPALHSF
jgi:hypothetical protein